MENIKNNIPSALKITIVAVLFVLLAAVISFFLYASQYYHAQPEALAIFNHDESLIRGDGYLALPAAIF